jgi:hypothetical protein
MAAKLPSSLIEPKQRGLSDLAVGETAYVLSSNVRVNESGECFLNPEATSVKRHYGAIQVDRREDGYHVSVIAKGMQWKPGPISDKLIPVVSVTEDYDPQLLDPPVKLWEKYGIK